MQNNDGFSLTEVLVASLVLLLAIGGVLTALSLESRSITSTGRNIEALNFAAQQLEQLKNEVRATMDDVGEPLRATGGWGPWIDLPGDFGNNFNGERRFRTRTVTGVPKETGYREVTVAVRWDEPQ